MKFRGFFKLTLLALFCLLLPSAVVADPIAVGQVDTFQTGPEGWHIGGGPGGAPVIPLTTVSGGGPAGAGDNYLLITATGSPQPGGRLVGINTSQWAGNYLTNGVNAITIDLNNFGPSDLSIRLLLSAPPFGPFGPENIVITQAFNLTAGSGWTTHTFSLLLSDLIVLVGSAEAALANAFELRIFHNPAPDFPGPPFGVPRVNAQLGVDNITATAVPEPATLVLLGTGLAGVGAAVRKRRKANKSKAD